jgi:hypothetical protein
MRNPWCRQASALTDRLSSSIASEYDVDPILTAFHSLAGEFMALKEEVRRKRRKAA